MAVDAMQPLPADLFHLVTAELAAQAESRDRAEQTQPEYAVGRRESMSALCNCILSSKYLATSGAVSALYRICLGERSPVKSGGSDNLSFAEQDVTVMRWSLLWRTIVLSALGKTLYPYCRYLRALDLRDLSELLDRLDEAKFKRVAKQLFAGDLARFHILSTTTHKTRAARLDAKKILLAIGDEITKQSPLLEALSEPSTSDVLLSALPTWTPRLAHLRSLEFWDGKLLASEEVRNLLHAHCPSLEQLQLYMSTATDSDHHLAAFISGMRANKLTTFENNSTCRIGPETCLALNGHGQSLVTLKLGLEEEGMLAMGLLQSCTKLKTLKVMALRQSVDLKATQNDVYLEIVEWLKQCDDLKELAFEGVTSAPDLAIPVLTNKAAKLVALRIMAKEGSMYVVKDHHDFHKALREQSSLRELLLRADPDPVSRDDVEILMDTFSSLTNLTDLNLLRISDYFSDTQICLLAQSLPRLTSMYVGGYGISDSVWSSVAELKHLKSLTFAGITTFTVDGILGFVGQLDEGNRGLVLSVEFADPDSMILDEGQEIVNDAIAAKIDGRFEYQPIRDPNLPEFEGSDSD